MSTDRLDVLRERNKQLLDQLRQQGEKLERLTGCIGGRKREREDEAEEPEKRPPEEIVTLTGADRGPARAALAKPSVTFQDTCEQQTSYFTSKQGEGIDKHATLTDVFKDSHRESQVHSELPDSGPFSTKSCQGKRDIQSRVTFQSDECEDILSSDRHHLQPLLGYDWIAGVLDTEDSVIERSDEFFNDLCAFRSLNKDECIQTAQTEFSKENHSVPQLLTRKDNPQANVDTHQCTFSYKINSRLFPVPLHSQECCPVCKKHKSSHPHTTAEPALIRVSIPRTALLPPYKYKAHRRCSFDPSDSLGLPSHCLSGWSNTGQSTLPPPGSLDLRSSLNMKNCDASLSKELEDLSAPKGSGTQNFDQISDVSRLARHNLQHFSPKRKRGSTFYNVC